MEKIRILYLITGLNPGGAELMLKKIIENLNRANYEIYVCAITNLGTVTDMIKPYVKAIYFLDAINLYKKAKSVFKLRKLIIKLNPHLLHCLMIHSNLLGRIGAIGLNVFVISSIRVKLADKRYLPYLFLDFLSQRLVNLYIVNSKTLHNFTCRKGIKRNKICLIQNGINIDKFRPKRNPESMKEELGLSNLPIISMIAHLREQKDYGTMLKALVLLKKELKFHFLSIGDDTKNYLVKEKIKDLILNYDLKNNVNLLGIRTDIPDILSITDVWVSSTLFEGQSNSLLEAMAMKTPIVTTNIEENAEVVRHYKEALLVPIKNPNELASSIKKLISDKNLSKTLTNNAYQRLKRNFDLKKQLNKLFRIYESLFFKNKRKIKVCFISHFGYPLYNRNSKGPFGGGAGVQLFLLSKQLMQNKNMNINVLTGNYFGKKLKIEIYREKIRIYQALPIRRKLMNYFRGFVLFFLILKKINPDIIIQRAASPLTGLSAIYCKLLKKFFIYTISSNSNITGADEKGFMGKLFKYGLDNASYVITQNNEQFKKLQNFKRKKFNNIITIKNGFEIRVPKKSKKKYVLWVGRAIKLKRPELFLRLAQKFPYEKFIMICYKDIGENYWKTIFKAASKIPNLKFFEYIHFDKIDQFFNRARVFVNTSTYEGFPNTFIQAFKNRTPVLSLKVNPDEILTNYKIGFFCNDDFNNLKTHLKLLLEKKDLFQIYSNNAYLYAKNNHNFKKISEKWKRLIETIISNEKFTDIYRNMKKS